MIITRLADLNDIDNLVELENQSFNTDKLKKTQFKRFIKSESSSLIIAEENKEMYGYGLMLYRRNSKIARLYSIATAQNAQRKGVAGQIHQALLRQAKLSGCNEIRLEVSESNSAAIKFYEKLNYIKFDVYSSYYEDGSNAIRMKLIF